MVQQESEQESDFQNWKISGPRSGFKNFGTGAESESEKVTTATSAGFVVEMARAANSPVFGQSANGFETVR